MRIYADLHLHSRYSQACSNDLSIETLKKWSRIKGLDLLGTSDFTHPEWVKELKEKLVRNKDGIYYTQDNFPFVLSSEISLIYSQDGRGRRIHHVVLAPSLEAVEKITRYLLKHGRVDYDGRPIFKIPSYEFVYELKAIDKRIEIIPAHIWTPWFSLYGSNSGFDSIKDCFKDQLHHIHAVETGLSSDPEMNWRIKELDNLTLVSNSDSHSYWPWRLGREANVFDWKELSYDNLIESLATRKGFVETIEVDPAFGKYHWDGHRSCNIVFSPEQSRQHKGICPVCKKPLTIGVDYRVEELAEKDRKLGFRPKNAMPFRKMIPLSEIIASITGKAVATKGVWKAYNDIMKLGKNEFEILLETPEERLKTAAEENIVKAILLNRQGKIKVQPGYDGVYGVPEFEIEGMEKRVKKERKVITPGKTKEKEDTKEKKRTSATLRNQKSLSEF